MSCKLAQAGAAEKAENNGTGGATATAAASSNATSNYVKKRTDEE